MDYPIPAAGHGWRQGPPRGALRRLRPRRLPSVHADRTVTRARPHRTSIRPAVLHRIATWPPPSSMATRALTCSMIADGAPPDRPTSREASGLESVPDQKGFADLGR